MKWTGRLLLFVAVLTGLAGCMEGQKANPLPRATTADRSKPEQTTKKETAKPGDLGKDEKPDN
jgi:hypothetical protein